MQETSTLKPSDIHHYHLILVQPQKLLGNCIIFMKVTNLSSISTKAVLKAIYNLKRADETDDSHLLKNPHIS